MISWSNFCPVGKEKDYILDAFSSGWVSGGSYADKFEVSLESVFTGSKAFAVSNGTAALQLALQALGASASDEIIMPSFCFQAGANVAVQLGLQPAFCDVERDTWNQSVETISKAYSKKTKGIVVVHNYGVSAPVKEICEWAHERGLWVIEDCAEAWFSKYKGKFVGQYGDISTYSMHATKTIASGEGGVVLVNDESLEKRVSLTKSHGIDRSQKHYYHLLPGNNYRLSNLLCAVALAQFEKRDYILTDQRNRSELYTELLGQHWAIELQQSLSEDAEDEIWAIGVFIHFDKLNITRDMLIELLASQGIEVRPGFYSASSLPYHSNKELIHSNNADNLSENIIVLPTNASVSEIQVNMVCDKLIGLLEQHSKNEN